MKSVATSCVNLTTSCFSLVHLFCEDTSFYRGSDFDRHLAAEHAAQREYRQRVFLSHGGERLSCNQSAGETYYGAEHFALSAVLAPWLAGQHLLFCPGGGEVRGGMRILPAEGLVRIPAQTALVGTPPGIAQRDADSVGGDGQEQEPQRPAAREADPDRAGGQPRRGPNDERMPGTAAADEVGFNPMREPRDIGDPRHPPIFALQAIRPEWI